MELDIEIIAVCVAGWVITDILAIPVLAHDLGSVLVDLQLAACHVGKVDDVGLHLKGRRLGR